MKKSQSKLKSPRVKRKLKNKTANEWTSNIYSCKQEFTDSNSTGWVYNLNIYSKH